jgi:hypothetical protein
VPGKREYFYTRQLGARPVSAADAAAWRQAGSPRIWRAVGLPRYWGVPGRRLILGSRTPGVAFATSPLAPAQTWQHGHGTLGYLEGDLPPLTLRQFRQLPTTTARLMAALRHEAMRTQPDGVGASADQLIWSEAINMLQDPVSQQVRAAAYRVMAELPRVRMLGRMRDPLGRAGYGVGTGPSALGEIAIINPATGSLLAYGNPGPPDGPTQAEAKRVRAQAAQIAARMKDRKTMNDMVVRDLLGLASWVRRADSTQWSRVTCVIAAGWTNTPPSFAGTASFHAQILY